MSNSIRLMSVEAKDLYNVMIRADDAQYKIRDKSGLLRLSRFTNTYDYSLDLIKLLEIYRRKYRNDRFAVQIGRHKYTQQIINVTFKYSAKIYNLCGKNTYVKLGYNYSDCDFQDGVYIKDGELIGIQTNVEVAEPVDRAILGKYFAFVDGHYEQIGNIPVAMDRAALRSYLYANGFVCDGIRYVRYKRSAGASRVGKCLFINEVLYKDIHKWDLCGLDIKDNQQIDLASFEAYTALSMSSIIDTLEIPANSILVIDDYSSKFKDDVVMVTSKDGKLASQRKTVEFSNSIWDGESLLDISMFGSYSDKGMLLLRNRFFKTCAFNTNIQKWFEDNGITSVKQLNGFTLATDISQIKLITTPNSIKYLKFGTIEQWLENIEPIFGIVKYEKETHYFDGRMVQCHYQLLNTLQLSYDEVERLLRPSLEYIGQVRSDPDVLRYHIGYPFRAEQEDGELNPLKSKNDIVFKMLGINNDFAKTQLYKEFRNDIVKGFMRNLKQGHLLLHGNYSTLLGNGVEMLQQAIGEFRGYGVIEPGCIHSTKFNYGATILASRSPHITMGNIYLARNVANEQIDRYFNLTNEIVYINAIDENIQQRLNGCDYDSDSILLTDNEILIDAAQKNYRLFKVPTCFVESQKTNRYYNDEHKADLDVKTSVNKIGEIVNLSQQLNSLFWEHINEGHTFGECEELYNDICKLAVLSGIEIDKAKREYVINSANEIERLKSKYKLIQDDKQVKPMFFKMITLENGFELSDKVHYRYFATTMDYLQQIIAKTNFRQARKYAIKPVPFMDIVRRPEGNLSGGSYSLRRDLIIDIVRTAKEDIRILYADYDTKSDEDRMFVWARAAERKQDCIDAIDRISQDEFLMYSILKELDAKETRDVYRFMFEVLFGEPNQAFFTMIERSKEPLYRLEESNDGDIKLYDFNFGKVAA